MKSYFFMQWQTDKPYTSFHRARLYFALNLHNAITRNNSRTSESDRLGTSKPHTKILEKSAKFVNLLYSCSSYINIENVKFFTELFVLFFDNFVHCDHLCNYDFQLLAILTMKQVAWFFPVRTSPTHHPETEFLVFLFS